ncbi:MAG: hypothetical protein ACRDGQ_05090, partial [Candidatus Limnocylindrales bacterium]
MKQPMARRLAGLAAVVGLLGVIGAGPVQATSAAAPPAPPGPVGAPAATRSGSVAVASPWVLASPGAARHYASGLPGSALPLVTRLDGPGRQAMAGRVAVPQPDARPAGTIVPAAATPPVQASLTSAPDHHLPGRAGLA